MNFSLTPHQQKIEKPWGYEVLYTPSELSYAGKILMVRGGCKLSFQYHDKKVETICLYSGKALVWLEDSEGVIQKVPMELFKGYTVAVEQKHRIEALEDSFILESSLPEMGTTVRISDDYARPDETDELRNQAGRGWQV